MEEIKITCKGSDCLPIGKLENFQGNLKTLEEKQLEKLKSSIIKYGFSFPVVVWGRKIIDGHQRIFATKELLKESYTIGDIPIVEIEAKNKKEAAEKLLVLNSHYAKMTDSGLHDFVNDFDINIENMPELELPDVNLDLEIEICEPGLTDDDAVPDAPEETITKLGDIYKLGNHRLMCGDSTSIDAVEKLMNGQKADMVFTDPPYGVDYTGGSKERDRLKDDHIGTNIYEDVVPVISMVCDGPCYTWYAGTKPLGLYNSVNTVGDIHALIIWVKNNSTFNMNIHYKQKHEPCLYWKPKGKSLKWGGNNKEDTVWELDREVKNDFHPTQKPVGLAERAINNHDIKSVLDLFGGSGSTLIACEKTKRQCYMMELDPKYCDVIVKRWEDYTGKKAELINATKD